MTMPITQEDRSRWQRQGAWLLCHVLERGGSLPALTWTLGRDGSVSGSTGGAVPAAGVAAVFSAWREVLRLGEPVPELGSRGMSRVHARTTWASVDLIVTAPLLASLPDDGGAAAAQAGPALPAPDTAWHQPQAAEELAVMIERNGAIEAISWQLSPSGGLSGDATVPGSREKGIDALAAWATALDLAKFRAALVDGGRSTRVQGRAALAFGTAVTVSAVLPAKWRTPRPGSRPLVAASLQPDLSGHLLEPPPPGSQPQPRRPQP